MSGVWKIVEQSATGEVQYVRARLQISDTNTTAQPLAVGASSAIFNVAGYTQGFISFQSAGISGVSLYGSVCTSDPANFFLLKSENINSGGIDLIYTLPLKYLYIKNDSGTPLADGYITIFCVA